MRTLLKVVIPAYAGNKAIANGALSSAMQDVMDKFSPEASYFYPENGKRAALFVFDLEDPTQIPSVAEPFFENMEAEVTLTPVMNADDLKAGLKKAGKSAKANGVKAH